MEASTARRIHDLDFLDRDIRSYGLGLSGQLVVCCSITFKRKAGERYRLALADILIVVGSFTGCHLEVFAVVVDGRCTCVRDLRIGRAVVDPARLNRRAVDCDLLDGDVSCGVRRLGSKSIVAASPARANPVKATVLPVPTFLLS